MQARQVLALGQTGAKKFLKPYGGQLICALIRYDDQHRNRCVTVEIIVEEFGWSPPAKPEIDGLRVKFQETELQGRVKQAGGRWNSTKRVWEIQDDQVMALGLKKRFMKLDAPDIRRH